MTDQTAPRDEQFDVIVLGGGPGGSRCSRADRNQNRETTALPSCTTSASSSLPPPLRKPRQPPATASNVSPSETLVIVDPAGTLPAMSKLTSARWLPAAPLPSVPVP